MDVLTSSAISTVNWFTSNSSSRDGRVGQPLAKSPVHYITSLYNYWQNNSRRNQVERSSPSSDEICYFVSLPVRPSVCAYHIKTSLVSLKL